MKFVIETVMEYVRFTKRFYPHLAKTGWCLVTNYLKKELPQEEEELLEFKKKMILLYKKLCPIRIYIAYDLPAFWSNGYEDPELVPIFLRIRGSYWLEDLGFVAPDNEFEKNFELFRIHHLMREKEGYKAFEEMSYYRFSLMDFD